MFFFFLLNSLWTRQQKVIKPELTPADLTTNAELSDVEKTDRDTKPQP